MEHYLIRATIIPEIVKLIQDKLGISEDEALKKFYMSSTGDALADDSTGLYGQSALYIFGLFLQEWEESSGAAYIVVQMNDVKADFL